MSLVTPKWGLDKRGLGNQSFLQKSLKNIEEQQKILEKSYKIDAKTTTRGGGAKRRLLRRRRRRRMLFFASILYDFSTIFGCSSMFFNDFCRKDGFPRPLLSRPHLGVTNFCLLEMGTSVAVYGPGEGCKICCFQQAKSVGSICYGTELLKQQCHTGKVVSNIHRLGPRNTQQLQMN